VTRQTAAVANLQAQGHADCGRPAGDQAAFTCCGASAGIAGHSRPKFQQDEDHFLCRIRTDFQPIRAGVLAAARCCCCSWSGPAPAWRGTPAAAARSPSRRPAATTSCTSTTSRSHRRGLPFLAPLSCLACPVLLAPCLSFPSPFFVTFCCPSPPFPAFSPLPRSLPF